MSDQEFAFIEVAGERLAFGRLDPPNYDHVAASPLITAYTAAEAENIIDGAFDVADLNFYFQNGYPACIGFGCARAMTILNRKRYKAYRFYQEAQRFDGISGPHAGSTVHGAARVLIAQGIALATGDSAFEKGWDPSLAEGIESVLYTQEVDAMRTCIAGGAPLMIGVPWYSGYEAPVKRNGDSWLQTGANRGRHLGGHCVTLYAVSDVRQALGGVNSHGPGLPRLWWVPYSEVEFWARSGGEFGLPVDRGSPVTDWNFLA